MYNNKCVRITFMEYDIIHGRTILDETDRSVV